MDLYNTFHRGFTSIESLIFGLDETCNREPQAVIFYILIRAYARAYRCSPQLDWQMLQKRKAALSQRSHTMESSLPDVVVVIILEN